MISPKVGTPRPLILRASENSRPESRTATGMAMTVRMIMILPYGLAENPAEVKSL